MAVTREAEVVRAFVGIADSVVPGDDVLGMVSGFARACVELLGVSSASLLLADGAGALQLAACSTQQTGELASLQVQRGEGPCLDCHARGVPVVVPDLRLALPRWPRFASAAVGAGFASVHAIPLRVRETSLGSLGLFGIHTGRLPAADLTLGQSLAHVASMALVTGKAAADGSALTAQLQGALDSRVVLEQAKGMISQLGGLSMEDAFAALRNYARDHGRQLRDVATLIVTRGLPATELLTYGAGRVAPRCFPAATRSSHQRPKVHILAHSISSGTNDSARFKSAGSDPEL